MSVILIPNQERARKVAIIAACGVALAVALVVVGMTQLTRDGPSSRAPIAVAPGGGATVAGSAAASPRAHGTRPATVYLLVGSVEQADAERARIAVLNEWAGPLEAVIVVAESDAAATNVRYAVDDLAALRDAEDLAPIRLIDLRPPTAGRRGVGEAGAAPTGVEDLDRPHFVP